MLGWVGSGLVGVWYFNQAQRAWGRQTILADKFDKIARSLQSYIIRALQIVSASIMSNTGFPAVKLRCRVLELDG